MKRIILSLVLLVLVSLCVSAEPIKFQLYHVVNIEKQFGFEFRNASSITISTVSFNSSVTDYVFATLLIVYNTRITTITGMTLRFSDLTCTEDVNLFYPYHLYLYSPDTRTPLATVIEEENAHGAGSAALPLKFYEKHSSNVWDREEIVDIAITLDDSDVAYGTYTGTISVEVTTQ